MSAKIVREVRKQTGSQIWKLISGILVAVIPIIALFLTIFLYLWLRQN